jgi:hypothetical protein
MQRRLLMIVLSAVAVGCGEKSLAFSEIEDFQVPRAIAEQPATKVFKTAEEFQQFFGAPAPASVDFSKSAVAYYGIGMKPNGGYGARIVSISVSATKPVLHLETEQSKIGKGCAATQALTYPHHLVRFDRSNSEFSTDIEASDSVVTHDCD